MAKRRRQRPGTLGGASRRSSDEDGPGLMVSFETVEERADGDWMVRRITGSASTKPYRCPGCEQLIPIATPHVVAWPVDGPLLGGGLDERRHWHTGCWQAAGRRGPRR